MVYKFSLKYTKKVQKPLLLHFLIVNIQLPHQDLFAVDYVNSFAWGLYFSTLQIVLYALTMPPNRNPSGYNLRLYCA